MEAVYLVCGARRPQLKRDPLGSPTTFNGQEPWGCANLVSSTDHTTANDLPVYPMISAVRPAGRDSPWPVGVRLHARSQRTARGSSVAGSVVRGLPNMRMKLTARGGRMKRKRVFLSAAATGCSLCAIR
jgi:hypothetical protein